MFDSRNKLLTESAAGSFLSSKLSSDAFRPILLLVWRASDGWPIEYVASDPRRFGYTVEEFSSGQIKLVDLIYWKDAKRVKDEVQAFMEARVSHFEQSYRIRTKTGDIRWVYVWTHVQFDENKVPLQNYGLVLDISSTFLLQNRQLRLADTTESIFLVLDQTGVILTVNQKTCDLLGEPRETIIGKNWIDEFVPANERAEIINVMQGAFRDEDASIIRKHQNLVQSRDGVYHHIHWSYTTERNPEDNSGRVIAFGLDLTLQQEMANRLEDITNNMPGAIFQYTVKPDNQYEIQYMSPGCQDIWEISPNEAETTPSALWDMVHPQDIHGLQYSLTESIETMERWSFEWRISTSITKQDRWLRGVGTPRRLPDGSTRWHSLVIDISREKAEAEARAGAMRKVIEVLSAALEKRDPYTAGHEDRVSKMCVQIGKKLGLDANRLSGLELGAMVHDVGKISVPAEILNKPTKLLDPEFELIKYHPENGAELVKNIDFEWPIAEMILQHHERMDGSGYPRGLKSDDILLEARIIAVADTLEAMANHRPYRPGLGLDKAMAELKQGAGIRYDAKVVSACVELIEEGAISM